MTRSRSLNELEAVFIRPTPTGYREVDRFADAEGVLFLCPTCFEKNAGPIGTEIIIAWFVDVPKVLSPGPGRWKPTGTSLEDLTLTPSINVAQEHWHGFIRGGHAEW